MKHLKSAAALLLCFALLMLCPAWSKADEPEMPDFWLYEKEDLPMLYEAASEYLINYGSGSITFCFAKKLVDEFTLDQLITMVFRAGHMASVEGIEVGYRTLSDGTLRVTMANMKVRSGEKMLEAWLFGDRSSLTKEESRCLDKVIQVMDSLMKRYPESSLELETAIYDYICDHVTYQNYSSDDARRETCTSASNAFMNGWGNCQAYSDLFRLMATIGGFNTGLISGVAKTQHMWNWIGTWFDGEYRVYMVDVTYGDKDDQWKTDHFYLNFGLDRTDGRSWPHELFIYHGFERYTDDSCTYYNGYTGFGAATLKDAAELCASLAKGGRRKAEILIFQNGFWEQEIENALNKALRFKGWQYSCFKHDAGIVISVWW